MMDIDGHVQASKLPDMTPSDECFLSSTGDLDPVDASNGHLLVGKFTYILAPRNKQLYVGMRHTWIDAPTRCQRIDALFQA